jgi:hypothetical protein
VTILACAVLHGCASKQDSSTSPLEGDSKRSKRLPKPVAETAPESMEAPVAFWSGGKPERQVDAAKASEQGNLLLDLGEDWTPYILTEASSPEE